MRIADGRLVSHAATKAAFVVTILTAPTLAGEEAAELAKYLPTSANAVAVVRMSAIFQSERAQTESWSEEYEARFLSGAAAIPPWVDTLVVGSLVHPAVPEEVWSAAVVRLPESVSIDSIAETERAAIEDLGGATAVQTRRNSYLMQPLPGILAAYRPAHRLEASRWIRTITKGQTSSLSPYLTQAVDHQGHVVLALDLRDLLDVRRVEQMLQQDERFASHAKLVKRLVPLLEGLRGITFAATIGETTQATVTLDFSDDVGPSSLTVKSLFVAALDDLGAAIGELAASKVQSVGESVTLTCELSNESLRRIISLIVTPSTPYQIAPESPDDDVPESRGASRRTVAPPDPTARYAKAVLRMIDDLQHANQRAKNDGRTAAWHENFARKIYDLPSMEVDRQALISGKRVAEQFRALGASLRGLAVEINAQQGTLRYDVHYQPAGAWANIWGGVDYQESGYRVSSNLQQVRKRQAAAVASGAPKRQQIWQLIENERTKLTQMLNIRPPAAGR